MSYPVDFKCKVESSEDIPTSIINSTGISFYQAHTDRNAMAIISQEIKGDKRDCMCRVPFCVTVEAEAFGANINITNTEMGPRFEGYKFLTIEEMVKITRMDLTRGRINEVLHCVELLASKGNVVVLNIEGPFTILGLLIDSMVIFKGMSKHRPIIDKALQVIEDSLVEYIIAGIEKGAKIISYADPTGALELVGPKLYKEISGRISYNILKRVEEHLQDAVMHLCGKTSIALVKTELCKGIMVEVSPGLTYGEAMCEVATKKQVKIIGHNCMTNTPILMQNTTVWKMELL